MLQAPSAVERPLFFRRGVETNYPRLRSEMLQTLLVGRVDYEIYPFSYFNILIVSHSGSVLSHSRITSKMRCRKKGEG